MYRRSNISKISRIYNFENKNYEIIFDTPWIPASQFVTTIPISTWTSIASSSNGDLRTAVTNDGLIYVSYDNGINWSTTGSSREWTGVDMSNNGQYQ
jgi:hypothetical protein